MPVHFARASRKTFVFGQKGIVLISTYLVLSVLLLYSSGMTMRAGVQRVAMNRLFDRYHATTLAQSATEQLREEFFQFLRRDAYQLQGSNAIQAMEWLDRNFGPSATGMAPAFSVTNTDGSVDAKSETNARKITLQAVQAQAGSSQPVGRAWIVNAVASDPPNDFSRDVTIEAEATVGSVRKRVRSTYVVRMHTSDIFKHAYFINNFGWFRLPNDPSIHVFLNGDARANGDFRFQGAAARGGIWNIVIDGDISASENPAVGDEGLIREVGGGVLQMNLSTELEACGSRGCDTEWMPDWNYWFGKASGFSPTASPRYWNPTPTRARPARQLSFSDLPAIGGGSPPLLPPGRGWDPNRYGPGVRTPDNNFDSFPRKFERQPVQDLPYLGNLALYQSLADRYRNGSGSTLSYPGGTATRTMLTDRGEDREWGTADDMRRTVAYTYSGGTVNRRYTGTGPLVLVGTAANPIRLDGPVIVPGDVIIQGVISGRGTIYAGRNLHIVGPITYQDPPRWEVIERRAETGDIRIVGTTNLLGKVCSNGMPLPPGGGSCP